MASQGIHTLSAYGKANVDGAERKARLRILGISAIPNGSLDLYSASCINTHTRMAIVAKAWVERIRAFSRLVTKIHV